MPLPRLATGNDDGRAHSHVALSSFTLGKSFGEGTYSYVKHAHNRATLEAVVLKGFKQLSDGGVGGGSHAERDPVIIREIAAFRSISPHERIVAFNGIATDDQDRTFLVLEPKDCDLAVLLEERRRGGRVAHLDAPTIVRYSRQILEGVAHCHSCQIGHRDLKPQNILVDKTADSLFLADFGMARHFGGPTRCMTPGIVTRWYRAPELAFSQAVYSIGAIDLWSVGCIIAELLTGRVLFPGASDTEQLAEIGKLVDVTQLYEGLPFQPTEPAAADGSLAKELRRRIGAKSGGCANDHPLQERLIDLVCCLLVADPLKRLSPERALLHACFRSTSCPIPAVSTTTLSQSQMQQRQQQQQQGPHRPRTAPASPSSPSSGSSSASSSAARFRSLKRQAESTLEESDDIEPHHLHPHPARAASDSEPSSHAGARAAHTRLSIGTSLDELSFADGADGDPRPSSPKRARTQ